MAALNIQLSDAHIASDGTYGRDFVLLPWGSVWRALPSTTSDRTINGLVAKAKSITRVQLADNYIEGSWEFAVACIVCDGLYQRGLQLLTSAIAKSKDPSAVYLLTESVEVGCGMHTYTGIPLHGLT